MKMTRKQLKKLIKESMKSMVIEPNMSKRSLHHSLQVPPLDPLKAGSLDDETLKQLKDLRSSGYEGSRQADELIDMLEPEHSAPPFGIAGFDEEGFSPGSIPKGPTFPLKATRLDKAYKTKRNPSKDKSYTDQKMMYDKIHSLKRPEGIDYLTPGDSLDPNLYNAAYKIDDMLHDAGLGWSDGHGDLKINQLLTDINDNDYDKAIFKIRNYLRSKDKETKAELEYIMTNHPEILYRLNEFVQILELYREEEFERYHKT